MEFSMRRVNALFKKEVKYFGKNMNVLFMCMLPIVFSIIYSKLFGGDTLDGHLAKIDILIMCMGMNLVMVSSFVVAMLIAEEKEKNTLRTLMLSGVSPLEFFTGKIFITFLISQITNVAIFFIIGISAQYLGIYILLTTLVVFTMMEIGALIGIISPNQMSTGVIGMPVLIILLMIPIFARFNKTLTKIAEFLPNHNMNIMLENIFKGESIGLGYAYNIAVILAWIIIAGVAFAYTYNKVGLDK